jgi:hypothetical protein
MEQLRSNPGARHASPASFIHKDLRDSTHVFLRQEVIRRTLQRATQSNRQHGQVTIIARERQVTVSAYRVKPAYISNGTQHETGSPPAQPRNAPMKPATPTQAARTTISWRTVRFPASFAI